MNKALVISSIVIAFLAAAYIYAADIPKADSNLGGKIDDKKMPMFCMFLENIDLFTPEQKAKAIELHKVCDEPAAQPQPRTCFSSR